VYTGDAAPARERGTIDELATAVRDGSVSATRLVEAALARIQAAAELNAVVVTRADEALAEARALDRAIRAGTDPGPLAGLPLLVKDIEDAAGLATTFGSLTRVGLPPANADGVVAARLRAAGAILVGKTNVPEFAFEGYTANRVFGATGNPWRLELSPGGSSGGSGAALAAGLVPIATATDVGGSIRIPAALCGLVGLKPTAGLIGRDPILASIELNSHGPLATTAPDARRLLEILRGPAAGDPGALPRWMPEPLSVPRRLLATERVATGFELPEPLAAAFRIAVERLARALRTDLVSINPGDVFPGGFDSRDWFRIVGVEQAHALGRETIEREAPSFDPVFLDYMQAALAIPVDEHAAARRRRYRYAQELDALLGEDAILATPTLTVGGWSADGSLLGTGAPGLPGWVFNTEPFNLTGHPAISMPAGLLPNGLPFGLQIVGPRFGDWLLLDLAQTWNATAPWPPAAPGYRPFSLEGLGLAPRKRTGRGATRRRGDGAGAPHARHGR